MPNCTIFSSSDIWTMLKKTDNLVDQGFTYVFSIHTKLGNNKYDTVPESTPRAPCSTFKPILKLLNVRLTAQCALVLIRTTFPEMISDT